MSRDLFAAQSPALAEPFRHEAFLYGGAEHFVAGAAAFVRGALEAGEAVLVAVVESRAALLRRALGRAAGQVEFLDMGKVGRNPARIIPAWQDWVDRNGSGARGFRGIAEPVWAGRTASEIAECHQHEELVNTAFDHGRGWWLLCPYDVEGLSASVVERAKISHAGRVEAVLAGEPLEEPPVPVRESSFDMASLAALRDHVAQFAEPVVGRSGAADAVLVVGELAANSIKYGGGAGILRLWNEGAAIVCEVRDDGVITDPLAGRRRPSLSTRGKAGLWIANQVCDLLQIRSAPGRGTVVRARLGSTGRA